MGESSNLLPVVATGTSLNKVSRTLQKPGRAVVIARAQATAGGYVPHITVEDARRLCEAVATFSRPKFRERNQLMIQTLFDGCLRVSELLTLRPQDITQSAFGWYLRLWSQKMRRWETCSVSTTMAAKLQSFAYREGIAPDGKLFDIKRARVFQIVERAFEVAGIVKPDGVGTVHVLRHSGALHRLQDTRNPQAVQEQLRHNSMSMTLRYMKTLAHEEALAIQSGVDFDW